MRLNLATMIHLRIITPKKIVRDEEINAITLPSTEGELTILPRHMNLFSMLTEGVIKIRRGQDEDYLAIGGGYMETDGKSINVLVSRAYHQDEINQELTEKALTQAKKLMADAKDEKERHEALSLYRRSVVDLKLLKKRKSRRF